MFWPIKLAAAPSDIVMLSWQLSSDEEEEEYQTQWGTIIPGPGAKSATTSVNPGSHKDTLLSGCHKNK